MMMMKERQGFMRRGSEEAVSGVVRQRLGEEGTYYGREKENRFRPHQPDEQGAVGGRVMTGLLIWSEVVWEGDDGARKNVGGVNDGRAEQSQEWFWRFSY